MKCSNSIKNLGSTLFFKYICLNVYVLDQICSIIKQVYKDGNIPLSYPAANKHLQYRLKEFVAKGKDFI